MITTTSGTNALLTYGCFENSDPHRGNEEEVKKREKTSGMCWTFQVERCLPIPCTGLRFVNSFTTGFTRLASFVGATAGDRPEGQARHIQVAVAARNIELLHESGNSNKRDRDGVIRTRVLSIGVVRIGVMIRNDRIFGGPDQRNCYMNRNDPPGSGEGDRPTLSRQLKPYEENYPTHDSRVKLPRFCIEDLETLSDLVALGEYEIESNLMLPIKEAQRDDVELWLLCKCLKTVNITEFRVDDTCCVFEDESYLFQMTGTREKVLTEASSSHLHSSKGQPKCSRFENSTLVEWHEARSLEIPMWKWDEISMDFVTVCLFSKRHDAIWWFLMATKSAHLLTHRKNVMELVVGKIFQQEIVRLHGTPTSIVSDRDPKFTSCFWKGLQKAWGTRLKFSTTFHPQTDGQSERTIQTLKNMLRLVLWNGRVERLIEGPELIEITNEKVAVAKEKLQEARSRQKSYADKHRRDLERYVFCPRNLNPFWIGKRESWSNKVIPFVKISLEKNHPEREATWETEESMRASYPHFFV
ncbi:DNA/RNA polymerases superfamily protein [Tanacetum coccineum]|uniref:DNA/RNA polymerases superfamily protein n=1 Tax=Tanacetum coccineum TaxID=301880 RepID=A0ABQ5EMK9_9ASTR